MVIAVRPDWSPTVAPPKRIEGEEELLLTGSEAIAQALRLADVDIVAAYPIRPYDAVMQAVATMMWLRRWEDVSGVSIAITTDGSARPVPSPA